MIARPAVQKREFAQTLLQNVPMEVGDFEDLVSGMNHWKVPVPSAPTFLSFCTVDAAHELHLPQPTVSFDARDHPLGETVDDGDTDAVQPARHFVAALAEFAARVEHRHHDFDCRQLLFGMHIDGNAASVVFDLARPVFVQSHADVLRVAGQGLVDGVVDGLVDELMQAALCGVSDVHAGPLAHRVEPAQNFDLFACIVTGHPFSFVVPFRRVSRSARRRARCAPSPDRLLPARACCLSTTYELAIVRSRPSRDSRFEARARASVSHHRESRPASNRLIVRGREPVDQFRRTAVAEPRRFEEQPRGRCLAPLRPHVAADSAESVVTRCDRALRSSRIPSTLPGVSPAADLRRSCETAAALHPRLPRGRWWRVCPDRRRPRAFCRTRDGARTRIGSFPTLNRSRSTEVCGSRARTAAKM